MSNVYGGISFSTSSECSMCLFTLVPALNKFDWSTEKGEWFINMNDRGMFLGICYNGKFAASTAVKANNTVTKQAEIERLSKVLSEHFSSGWIEIACCANDENEFIYFENIRIYADGKAERRRTVTSASVMPVNMHEVYEA